MEARHDDSAEDAALALRITAGPDPDAEALLCLRLHPRIRAYGWRHLGDEAAASDLAQEILVIVIEALRARRVDQPERLAAFVMGACRNTVLDWRKIDRRRASLLERFGPSLAAAVESAPAALDAGKLGDCLEELAPRARAILTLTYFADRDAGEIAGELAMSIGNVRVTRHRALAQLQDCLTRGEQP
jgi:RNA polymerase sigma-70 factor (ECF subfamily)